MALTFTIKRGTDVKVEVTVTNDDGSAADLSNSTLHYRVARSVKHAPLLEIDTPDMTIASNVVTIPLTAVQTKGLPVVNLYNELYEIVGGEFAVLETGTITVERAQASQHV